MRLKVGDEYEVGTLGFVGKVPQRVTVRRVTEKVYRVGVGAGGREVFGRYVGGLKNAREMGSAWVKAGAHPVEPESVPEVPSREALVAALVLSRDSLREALERAEAARLCIGQNRGYDKELAGEAYESCVAEELCPALLAAVEDSFGDVPARFVESLARKVPARFVESLARKVLKHLEEKVSGPQW